MMDPIFRALGRVVWLFSRCLLVIVHAILSSGLQSASVLGRGFRREWARFRAKNRSGHLCTKDYRTP
jgi:hypothetical protein